MINDFEWGRISERLDGHDKRLDGIHDSMMAVERNLAALNLGIQRLVDSAEADRATVLTTAKALKDAEDARRDKVESRWSPVQRLTALLGSMGAIVGVLFEVLHH